MGENVSNREKAFKRQAVGQNRQNSGRKGQKKKIDDLLGKHESEYVQYATRQMERWEQVRR